MSAPDYDAAFSHFGEDCCCDWPDGCGGLGVLLCCGCGGDLCVCACGGEAQCDGCDQCGDSYSDDESDPIGFCPKCNAPWYHDEGFCGGCTP